jgi:tetratricopeptide (TPR) repeat protein/predicted Ser/Thr protein kinase
VASLQERLQSALGQGYRVEKELGGGGMSRVFLAEEVRLGRRVVVKVLPPEMAAGVSVDRFEREIQLAAKLQHPHVVPLLTAGSSDDLLYYIMPFIEGESLRAKLAREGELPVAEALRILRNVLDALAYAHRHQVVHRDIKPDNVLLAEGHALVTDFGVAKAVSESTGGQSLTSLGVALGTPLYMAPEQAAANPNVDHRADIYAAGVLAYEMLCGRPPFMGPNPQAVLSAHVTQAPEPCVTHRPAVPPGLNALVMRCLEKHPADRWQRAEEVLPQVDAMLTPTGGITPTGTQPVPAVDYEAMARRAHPVRVAALFGAGSVAVLALVYLLMLQLGLPDWVFLGAVGLLAVGLPIMLTTGAFERRRAIRRTTMGAVSAVATVSSETGVRGFFTWRRALLGGGVAFAALSVATMGYMAMRQLGVGPVGTLVATGVIAERDPLVVADFENRTSDSTLGPSVTEAFRIDLAQSPVVKLLDGAGLVAVLERMGREPSADLDAQVAREVAEREGGSAFVVGEVAPLGAGFVLLARVMSTSSGDVLLALRETAADETAIIAAVDRLSAKLRERLGESLKTIRRGQPLEQVTTTSLDALRRYTQATRVFERGDWVGAIPLLEEAITFDSTFAMAYRRLAVAFFNTQAGRSRIVPPARKAFQYRDRLPRTERYLTEAYYYSQAESDRERAAAAYRSLLEIDPENGTALNNLALFYNQTRRYREAEELARRAIQVGDVTVYYNNALNAQMGQGKYAAAESTLARFAMRMPGALGVWLGRSDLAAARGDFATAAAYVDSLLGRDRSPVWRAAGHSRLAYAALARGKLTDAERHTREAMAANQARGVPGEYINGALVIAQVHLLHRDDPARALREIDAALARHPLSTMPASDRPYTALADAYARAGRVDLARRTVAEYEREVEEALRRADVGVNRAAGSIALAEGRWQEAVVAFRSLREEGLGALVGLPELAEAYDRAGNVDSAVAHYGALVNTPLAGSGTLAAQQGVRAMFLARTYKRMGELYEQRGDREKALESYGKLVDLWKEADPELQPVVTEVKQRMARLAGEGR